MKTQQRAARTVFALSCTVPLVLAMTACGGGDDPEKAPPPVDPLQVFRIQKVNWGECPSELDQVQTLFKAQCATIRAPQNYADPAAGAVDIAVFRIASTSPARRGAIFYNPGGPGVDGRSSALTFHRLLYGSDPASPLGKAQIEVLKRYDMVGFAPRGVAPSTTLSCSSTATHVQTDTTSSGHDRPGNVDAIFTNARLVAEACKTNPLAPYINTDATARDMDLIRQLLGDDRLSYIGYSYGTWLGAWYASLFPDHVDRMVLDSNADFSNAYMNFAELQPGARERLLDEVIAPYAARHADVFGLGSTPDAVRSALRGIRPSAIASVAAQLSNLVYRTDDVNELSRWIRVASVVDQTLKAHPNASEPETASLLAHQAYFNDRSTNAKAQALAVSLNEAIFHMASVVPGGPTDRTVSLKSGVYDAVQCNDSAPVSVDLNYWLALDSALARQAPIFGIRGPATLPCLYWGGPSVQRPPLSAMKPLNVLMVQSEYDAATPTEGARRAFAALPNAKLVYVPGEYAHGVFPYKDQCVDGAVIGYLLGQDPTARELSCPARPLGLDALQVAKSAPGNETYVDPARAEQLIRKLKERIGR